MVQPLLEPVTEIVRIISLCVRENHPDQEVPYGYESSARPQADREEVPVNLMDLDSHEFGQFSIQDSSDSTPEACRVKAVKVMSALAFAWQREVNHFRGLDRFAVFRVANSSRSGLRIVDSISDAISAISSSDSGG